MSNSLKVSEVFYSVQAEGVSTGVPSIFIRLSGCNLMCGGPGGSLKKAGKATWWCDTEAVWRAGKPYTNEDLLAKFEEFGQLQNVINARTHLVWTGGEPTMPTHVQAIKHFLDFLYEKYPDASVFNEIETNGTIPIIEDTFYHAKITKKEDGASVEGPYIHQINCSPKLANSGMAKNMRINKRALDQVLSHPSGYLKFVISNEEDMKEIEEDFIEPLNVPWHRVVLMPGLDKAEDAAERTRFIYEMAKKYGYRAVTRGHIVAYDQTTGV